MTSTTDASWKRTFYACFVAQGLAIVGFSIALPFTPFYLRELGVTDALELRRWSGMVMAGPPLSMVVFAPIWGLVADRFGRRLMVVRAMFGGALVLSLMGCVATPGQLLACRVLQGALTGTISAMLALVASVTPRARTGYALGMMQAAVAFGFAIGPWVGGHLAAVVGYRGTFLAAGVFLFTGGALVLRFAKERFERHVHSQEAPSTFRKVLTGRGFLVAAFALFTLRFANAIVGPVFPLFVEDIRGSSVDISRTVGNILAAGGLATAVGAFYFGRKSDRWGHRRLLVLSCVVGGVGSFAYLLAQAVGHVLYIRIAVSFGAAGMRPAANAIIHRGTDDHNMGKAYGLTASLGAVGWGLGALSGGELAARLGLTAPFVLMGILLLLAAGLVFRFIAPDPEVPADGDTAPEQGV